MKRNSPPPLEQTLKEFDAFLSRKQLATAKTRPYLVRWAADFLRYARKCRGMPFEEAEALYLRELDARLAHWHRVASMGWFGAIILRKGHPSPCRSCGRGCHDFGVTGNGGPAVLDRIAPP